MKRVLPLLSGNIITLTPVRAVKIDKSHLALHFWKDNPAIELPVVSPTNTNEPNPPN
jgi:hypothetical protein